MEDQKLFHLKDAFFIAERLDAIQNALPIPPHTEKEFHSSDNYIIWTKLSAAVAPVVNRGSQIYSMLDQVLLINAPFVWTGQNEAAGVNFALAQITVTDPGIYTMIWTIQHTNFPIP